MSFDITILINTIKINEISIDGYIKENYRSTCRCHWVNLLLHVNDFRSKVEDGESEKIGKRQTEREKQELAGAKLDHAKFVLCALPGGFPRLLKSSSAWVGGLSVTPPLPPFCFLGFLYPFCFFPISICSFLSSLLLHVLAEFLLLFLLLCLIFWNRKLVVNFLFSLFLFERWLRNKCEMCNKCVWECKCVCKLRLCTKRKLNWKYNRFDLTILYSLNQKQITIAKSS